MRRRRPTPEASQADQNITGEPAYDAWPSAHNLSSLRLLGTVGEPIKEPEWNWYNTVIGKERCPIVDTWWQTETGGILIAPQPGAIDLKPGSATKPF